jgi:hypothetical protein
LLASPAGKALWNYLDAHPATIKVMVENVDKLTGTAGNYLFCDSGELLSAEIYLPEKLIDPKFFRKSKTARIDNPKYRPFGARLSNPNEIALYNLSHEFGHVFEKTMFDGYLLEKTKMDNYKILKQFPGANIHKAPLIVRQYNTYAILIQERFADSIAENVLRRITP